MPTYDLHLTATVNAWYAVEADTVEEAVAEVAVIDLWQCERDDDNAIFWINKITTEGADGLEHEVDFAQPALA